MGLFDFLKRKKKKAAPEAPRVDLGSVDLSQTEDLETRYTEEYREYLAAQETGEARAAGETPAEAAPEAPAPEEDGGCGGDGEF